jgi:hypothetical protein
LSTGVGRTPDSCTLRSGEWRTARLSYQSVTPGSWSTALRRSSTSADT